MKEIGTLISFTKIWLVGSNLSDTTSKHKTAINAFEPSHNHSRLSSVSRVDLPLFVEVQYHPDTVPSSIHLFDVILRGDLPYLGNTRERTIGQICECERCSVTQGATQGRISTLGRSVSRLGNDTVQNFTNNTEPSEVISYVFFSVTTSVVRDTHQRRTITGHPLKDRPADQSRFHRRRTDLSIFGGLGSCLHLLYPLLTILQEDPLVFVIFEFVEFVQLHLIQTLPCRDGTKSMLMLMMMIWAFLRLN